MTTTNELVSIIVPVYNVENYVKECVDSLLKQTYKKIEIILVNDGSTDNSYEIIKGYEDRDERIIIINKQNGGLSSARNAGLEIARGGYIVFVDSDDFIPNDAIEYMVSTISDANASIGAFASSKIHTNGSVDSYLNENCFKTSGGNCASSLMDDIYECGVSAWAKIYSYESIANIRFPDGLQAEDSYFSFAAALHSDSVVVDKRKSVYFYRMRANSIVMTKNVNSHSFDFYSIYRMCYDEAKGFPDIQKKCARRVVRSYISIIGKVYQASREYRNTYKKHLDLMRKTVSFYYNESTNLSVKEKASYYLAKKAPHIWSSIYYLHKKED